MADIIIDEEGDNKDNDNSNNNQIDDFETDLLKYNFDYTTKFKTCNLNEKEKKLFILNLFLMSSKLNIFNKVVCLSKIINISKERNNNQMIFRLTYKIMKYLKGMRIPQQYVDIYGLFSNEFLIENYNFAFKTVNDIKKITSYKMSNYIFDKEIKEYIKLKIESFKVFFKDYFKDDKHITCLYKVIDKILKENAEKEKNKIKENANQINNNIKDNTGNIIINNNEKDKKNINNIDNINNNEINKIVNNTIVKENSPIIDINSIDDKNQGQNNEKEKKEIININVIDEEINKKEKKEIININDIDEEINNKEKKEIININNIDEQINNKEKNKEKQNKIKPINKLEEKDKINELNNQYLYAINKIWLINIKIFLDNYLFAKEINCLKNFFNESFNPEYVLDTYLSDEKIWFDQKTHNFCPFPGPINNIPISDFKDQWIDPDNKEENDLLKKNAVNGEDYFLINYNDWKLLNNCFTSTNEIKRKKDNIDMISFGVIILDQRFIEYKNHNINLLKKKYIQIGKNATIFDFIKKIYRAVDFEIFDINKSLKKNNEKNEQNINKIKNDNKNQNNKKNINENINKINDLKNNENINIVDDNNNNNDKNNNINKSINDPQRTRKILFYKVKKNNKDIIIEMLICFINDILIYESVFIQELKFSNNKNIQEIFKNYNPKTELLIIEIINIGQTSQFLHQIKTVPNSKIYNCSICNKKIEDLNDTKYNCELCSMYLFCSKECGKNQTNEKGINHHRLHTYLSELILNKFNLNNFLTQIFYSEIYTNDNIKKNKGILGLYNLGNTCYMNCSLQCLSNTKDLLKYFLNNYYQNEVNLNNKYGTSGALLKSYSDLISEMWLTNIKKLNPYFFRLSFCLSTRKFANNQQQDAMEFLTILLNNLHEDLNRVREKPYIQIEQQLEKEKDNEASERYWNYYIKRENSIIVDLFHGQFKNIIKCGKCLKEKKTYESFINITLPIPEEHNYYIIKFFTHLKCKYITININSETTFGQLVNKGLNYLSKKILDAWGNMKKNINKSNETYYKRLLESCIEIVKLDNNKIINTIYSQPDNELEYIENYQKKLLKYIGTGEEIVLFEKEIFPDYQQNIYVYPVIEKNNSLTFLSYPVVFSVKHNLTFEQLEALIFDKFKHILINNTLNNNNRNFIIDLNILHSQKNVNTGLLKILKQYKKCQFCNTSFDTKQYCPLYFSFDKKDTVQKLFNNAKTPDPIVLLARSSYFDKNKKVYADFNFEENNLINKYKNIYDSFNIFGKSECLGENNLLYCPNCQKNTIIYKSIRIFKAPKYLIIQLKRFKKKSDNFFNFLESDKNDTYVSFPTKNLDLTNYIYGPDKFNAVYNLYAIINHKSTLGFNHFTAYCRNNNRWIEYDDSNVFSVNQPITNDAYILFYIKKDIDE